METFDNLKFDQHTDPGWSRARIMFDNGYGVSVVHHSEYSYGGSKGLWELAVLDSDGDLTYNTPVTEDVEGHLSESAVTKLMAQVQELPKEGV